MSQASKEVPPGSVASDLRFYVAMLLGTALVLAAIYLLGSALYSEPVATSWVADLHRAPTPLLRVLMVLAVVIVVSHGCGLLCARLSQPAVIGEILGGIIVGPSICGSLFPEVYGSLMHPTVIPILEVVGQLGIILYMFLVGLEFNPRLLRQNAHAAVIISHAGMLMPLVSGCALGLLLFPTMAPEGSNFLGFTLFMGVAMAITAFPVLARILTDRNLHKTTIGTVALACAAVDDATAWCLLALAIGCARADLSTGLVVVGGTIAYIVFMLLAVRPLLARCTFTKPGQPPNTITVSMILLALVFSAIATELIGIHALFGAFLFGAILPRQEALTAAFRDKLQDVVRVLLMPAFFALTGMRTEIGLLGSADQWLICLLIIAVAILGKCVGTIGAARFRGFNWRDSTCLGLLMNTRGLMEIIVLNIGLEQGIISPQLFTMMVLMALLTTMITGPALEMLRADRHQQPALSS